MDKQQKIILSAVSALLAVILLAAFIILTQAPFKGSFTPPAREVSAQSGTPTEIPAESLYGTARVENGFFVSLATSPALVGNELYLYFTSPQGNTAWISVEILDGEGETLAKSGYLLPGEYLSALTLSGVPTDLTGIKAKILSYEPDTYYSLGGFEAPLTVRAAQ